jgi:hypothetical protein
VSEHVSELDNDRTELPFPAMKELRTHLTDVAEFVRRTGA